LTYTLGSGTSTTVVTTSRLYSSLVFNLSYNKIADFSIS
jgi:hypothetical protein